MWRIKSNVGGLQWKLISWHAFDRWAAKAVPRRATTKCRPDTANSADATHRPSDGTELIASTGIHLKLRAARVLEISARRKQTDLDLYDDYYSSAADPLLPTASGQVGSYSGHHKCDNGVSICSTRIVPFNVPFSLKGQALGQMSLFVP